MKKSVWNKGKSVGQKKEFTLLQVKAIKSILTDKKDLAGLALLSCGIDSMLRSSDITKIKVGDLLDFKGEVKAEFAIKQQKNKRSVRCKLSESTIQHIQNYLDSTTKFEDDYLFTALNKKTPMSYNTHWRRIKEIVKLIGLDYRDYGTHSPRRTNPVRFYKETQDIGSLQELLGHKSINSTVAYIGVNQTKAFELYNDFLND